MVALVAASMALLPGVAFWDTGELQAVGPLMGTAHPTGFPTYVLLGWLASVVLQPFGEPAFRMNLLSAICLAVAAGVTVDLVRGLTGRLVLGVAAGVGLALTPIAWSIATHAEAHALHLALVAILLWLLVEWETRVRGGATTAGSTVDRGDRFLIAASIVFGLSVGNHSLTLLLAIPVGLYVLAVDPGIWRRGRLVLTCIGALVVTVVLVYLELPLGGARAVPRSAGVRNAVHVGRVPLHRPRRAVPGQPRRPLRRAAAQVRRAHRPDGQPVRHPRAAHPGRASWRPLFAGRATRC